MSENDHRQFTRIAFPVKARVRHRGKDWETGLLDVSLKGALFDVPKGWSVAIGEEVELWLTISSDIEICMQGEIAHMENRHAGLVCRHIDVDSAAHLRRLVELNLGDDSRLHRELSAMINLS